MVHYLLLLHLLLEVLEALVVQVVPKVRDTLVLVAQEVLAARVVLVDPFLVLYHHEADYLHHLLVVLVLLPQYQVNLELRWMPIP